VTEREYGRQPRPGQDSSTQRRRTDRARRTVRSEQETPPKPARRRQQQSAKQRDRARTGGAFGLSATRQAAVLAMVVCALALSIAVPLRTYLTQHAEVRQEQDTQSQLVAREQQLERRKAQLSDPAEIEAEARSRLRMVMPGETPYTVQLPGDGQRNGQQPSQSQQSSTQPWYEQLWDSITGSGT
jgi:cell division protein FtsB